MQNIIRQLTNKFEAYDNIVEENKKLKKRNSELENEILLEKSRKPS